MKKLITGIILATLLLALAVPVLAAYVAIITVVESNGTDYTELALNLSMNVTYLVDNNYITSTGLDTRITNTDYEVLPHMLAEDRVLWVSDIVGYSTTEFYFYTGQNATTSFPVITGHGGHVTVPDNADLELGGVFAIAVVGYVDMSAGSGKYIIEKDGALSFNVSAANELTFAVTGGTPLVASSISSGEMSIIVFSDGYDMWMEIDGAQVGSNVTATSVPDTANNWTLFQNDVMPYIDYYSMWIVT